MVKENKREMDLTDAVFEDYIDYSLSTMTRILPAQDGVNLVDRRILHVLKKYPKLTKSGRIVGDVMGKYHPHGDSSIYNSMVNMVIDNLPMVKGQGNWGCKYDGSKPAAQRYTEAMASIYFDAIMDRDSEVAYDKVKTYDGTGDEPYELPLMLPLYLINGANGAKPGLFINIPPHNPTEILQACIASISNKYKMDDVTCNKYVKGPDHRLSCGYVVHDDEYDDVMKKGIGGKIKIIPKIETHEDKLIIEGLPIGRNVNETKGIIAKILAKDIYKKVEMKDHSKHDAKIVLLNVEASQVDELITLLGNRLSTNAHYNFIYTCKQNKNEEASLEDDAVYLPIHDNSIASNINRYMIHRRSKVKKATEIHIEAIKHKIKLEEFKIKFLNKKDRTDNMNILEDSENIGTASNKLSTKYNTEYEIVLSVISSLGVSVLVNKSEYAKNRLEALLLELKGMEDRLNNIDEYMIDQLRTLKTKMNIPRKLDILKLKGVK